MEEYEIRAKNIDDLTENSLNGKGVFDRLMGSVELHIQDEFKKNRITGNNYAQAYLGALQSVLQFATQFTLQCDMPLIELEKLRLEREKMELELKRIEAEIKKINAEIDLTNAQIKLAEAELKLKEAQLPLIEAQVLAEQAKTRDIIDSTEEVTDGTNIHGLFGWQIRQAIETIDNSKKAAAVSLAKHFCVDPFSTIEASEGIGASYYGLNGGNSIEYLNALRKAFGLSELGTTKYSNEHKEYMNEYAPDKKLDSD